MTQSNITHFNGKPVGVNWKGILGNGAIALSWLYLNWRVLQWFYQALHEISQFNFMLLSVGGLFLVALGIRYRQDFHLSVEPVFRGLPLILILGCGVGAIVSRWLIDLEQFPALLFILGTYGLLGLFLHPAVWRKGLTIAVAIACILPFGMQSSINLGFPARVLTAHIVEQILATGKVTALSSEDIIVLDTGIAHVDLPCSGLKSLWTGSLFLLAATWLEGRKLGWRWLLVCAANVMALIIANIGRVLTLVAIAHVLKQPALAEILHIPLGLMSFGSVCLFTWILLRWVPRSPRSLIPSSPESPIVSTTLLTQTALILCILGLTLIPYPAKIATPGLNLPALQWSTPLQTQLISLEPIEQDFFTNYPGVVAQKQKFQFQGITGTLLLVSSPTWQAHHAPELCLVGSGFQVNQMEKKQFTSEILGRWLSLNSGTRSAAYWFQSPHNTTDDYLLRIGSEIMRQERTWTLISIVFDRSYSPNDARVKSFLTNVHLTLDRSMSS